MLVIAALAKAASSGIRRQWRPLLDVQASARTGVSPQSIRQKGSSRPTASHPALAATTPVTLTRSLPSTGIGKASGRAAHVRPAGENQLAGRSPIVPTATTPLGPAASLSGDAFFHNGGWRSHRRPSVESRNTPPTSTATPAATNRVPVQTRDCTWTPRTDAWSGTGCQPSADGGIAVAVDVDVEAAAGAEAIVSVTG